MDHITLPLFPLRTILFPGGYLPLQIFEVRYLSMIKKAIADKTDFGVVTLTAGSETRIPERGEIFSSIGTIAHIVESSQPMAGLIQLNCRGTQRFSIQNRECLKDGLWIAELSLLEDDRIVAVPEELRNVAAALKKLVERMQQEKIALLEMPIQPPFEFNQCGWVANRWAELITIDVERKRRLLELDNPVVRLELIQDLLDEAGFLE